MLNRMVLPAAAAAIVATFAFAPAPANASWTSAPASVTHADVQSISDVIEVRKRKRHHRQSRRHHRRHGPYYAAPHFFAPYAQPRRCGYVWSGRAHRNIWRCW
jgi:hypothetical protein